MSATQKSRIGKKQICCYVRKKHHIQLVNYAKKNQLTYQQAFANIINAYCRDLGKEEVLPKFEVVPQYTYRKTGKALVRKNASTKGRRKLISISGWYLKRRVHDLIEIARESGMTLQDFCSAAIITKAKEMATLQIE